MYNNQFPPPPGQPGQSGQGANPKKWQQMKGNLVDLEVTGATAEEDSGDFVVKDSHSPYLPSRLFFHFLIITKMECA